MSRISGQTAEQIAGSVRDAQLMEDIKKYGEAMIKQGKTPPDVPPPEVME